MAADWPTWLTAADLVAVLVEHAVLVVELDQLGLLVHDQDRLGEDPSAAPGDRSAEADPASAGAGQLGVQGLGLALVGRGSARRRADRAAIRLGRRDRRDRCP